MTPLELNRDIKRLGKKFKEYNKSNEFDANIDTYFKAEIRRLYYADDTFKTMNKASVLTLVRMNLRYRAITLHFFGGRIEL